VREAGRPGRKGRIGAVRSRAWIWDFSSTHSTTAASGGCRYNPTMSRTLASSSGSVENLNVPDRWGWIPKCFHSRAIVAWDTGFPLRRSRSASNREDQCVIPSSAGGSVNVIDKISSRTDCGIVGGLPDRGASARPASPRAANRERHITTVGSAQPTRAAICFPGTPSADSSTIRARSTSRAGEPFARTLRASSTRSASQTVNTFTRFGMPPVSHRTHQKLMRHATRSDRSSGHSTVTERTDSPRYAASMTEPSLPDEILDHYANRKDEDARLRGGQGRLEFARVQEIVRRNLPEGPQRILDVGGATGVHAEWLLADGHQVHLIDPVPSHVARATESLGANPAFSATVGDARRLPAPDASYDVVLLFGI